MKNINVKFKNRKENIKNQKGITLVALVVTIVVLLILTGVSLNLLIGNNGIMTRAKQSKISNDLSAYKEQLAMFIADKKVENPEFYESSLTAGKNNLYYNTKTSEDEKTIKDIIKDVKDEYLDSLEVVKGKLTINTQDKNIIKVAQAVGVEPNPYVIKDGELMSNNGNLLLVDEQGTLTLPDSVTKIGEGAFANVEGLKTIIIPGTVKTIGRNAFRSNTTLEKVVIQEGVEKIEDSAFAECGNLVDVSLADTITSIGREAFYLCRKLETIEIPTNLEEINEMTFSLTGISSIKLRGDKVRKIQREAFCGCKMSHFTITKNVEYIDATAFSSCLELTDIVIDDQNNNFMYSNGLLMTKSMDNIIFVSSKYYENKTTFEIPEGIIEFSCNISKLDSITKLIIPANTKSISARNLPQNISQVVIATNNENLKTVEDCIYTKTEPEILIYCYSKASEINLKGPAKEVKQFAFKGATNATKIELNEKTEKIENQVFSQNKKLKEVILGKYVNNINPLIALGKYDINITIDKENSNYILENGVLYNKNKDKIITVFTEIKGRFNLLDSVKTIGTSAFAYQYGITEINLLKIERIENHAFFSCYSLKNIEIPNTIKEILPTAFLRSNSNKQNYNS